jgi:DHA1 family multidrug resistance protein-like MFS transporter
MFLSPLSEVPSIGRNLPYLITLAIFVILQVPTVLVHNVAGFMILRFLAGFFGSPALATAGASISDMYSPKKRAYAIGVWGLAAVCGPVLGPLIGGFAAQAKGWRWTIWPLFWLSGGVLLVLLFTLPETSAANILVRRAKRLRRVTGNTALHSVGERAQSQMTGRQIAMMTLVRPFVLTLREPIVFFLNLYIGLIYAILYVWFEAFPLVFSGVYGFNAGEQGLAFMGIFVGAVVTYLGFAVYARVHLEPTFDKKGGVIDPENRLPPAMFGAWFIPICMFWFGWTSTASIHWMVPIIGSSFFSIGTFLLFQSVLNYLVSHFLSPDAPIDIRRDDFDANSTARCVPGLCCERSCG